MASADFTVAEFLAWARTKPADEEYRYWDIGNCAVAQFAKSRSLDLNGPERRRLELLIAPFIFDTPRHNEQGTRKFGDLVLRLEISCPEPPISETWTKPNAYLADIETVSA
jgi:hypothetical protein